MWQLIHFLVFDGVVVNSNLYADITTTVLETIFDRTIAGTSLLYKDAMVATEVISTLTRVQDLFSCFLETKAAMTKYVEFETQLFEAWTAKFTGIVFCFSS